MRVSLGNTEPLKKENCKVARKRRTGFLLAAGIIAGSLYGLHLDAVQNSMPQESATPIYGELDLGTPTIADLFNGSNGDQSISAEIEDINKLNVIINDCDCRDNFVSRVCEELDKAGIKYKFTTGCQGVDTGGVVVTLDQKYMAGPGAGIFVPLDNERSGQSDALALASKASFEECGLLVGNVACGQLGFRDDGNGNVSNRIPSPTEDAISKDKDISLITISLGTQNTDPEAIGRGLIGALVRYSAYINNDGYSDTDLIVCVQDGETYDDVATNMGVTGSQLRSYNRVSSDVALLAGDTLINPNVQSRKEFDASTPAYIEVPQDDYNR